MNAAPTDWLTAIAILSSGLILGLMLVYFVRRRPASAPAEDLVLRDLEAKRDTLIEELRAADLTPEERTRIELETAKVLRDIDAHNKVERQAPSPAAARKRGVEETAPAKPNRAALVGFAWGAGSVLVLVGLGYFVMQSAKSRDASSGMTGGQTSTMAPAQPPANPAVQRLEAAVKQSPDDLDARVALAKAYLETDNLMGVFDQTQYVLSKSPNDSRALTYQALVRLAMGQGADADSMLEKATKSDPNFIDAWVALAWVKTAQGKAKEAEAAIAEAAKRHPEEKQRLEQVYAEMKRQGGQQATATAELPPGHPTIPPAGQEAGAAAPVSGAGSMAAEGGGAPLAGAPQANEPAPIHITLSLDPAAKSKTGVLFIMARPEGVTAGPPLAVKRVASPAFPVTVDLSAADSMMGQPLPPKVRLEARLVSSGDVMTHNPQDPDVVLDHVAGGSTIKLALK